MFPKSAVGSVVGIGTCAGSSGGMLIAAGTGWILQLTHSYNSLFAIAATVYLLALLIIVMLAPGLKKAEMPA
jgi:ACS family hexuronate transporter-like MFS transporter